MQVLITLMFFLIVPMLAPAQGLVTAVAGNGSIGFSGDGGAATNASLGLPNGVAVDSAGNVYIADALNHRIRKVDVSGKIGTLAGNGLPLLSGDGGQATSAGIGLCATATHQGVVADEAGNVYFTDCTDNRIRKVDKAGIITTVVGKGGLGSSGFSGDGGPAVNAELAAPWGLAIDKGGNLYIADTGNGRIRKVDTAGIISTVAGRGNGSATGDGGPAVNAQLGNPTDVAVDGAGNIYIADFGNSSIRKVDTSGTIRSILHGGFGDCQPGSKPAAAADIGAAVGLALDGAGNLFVADRSGSCVHKFDTSGNVRTYAGGGGDLTGNGIPATSIGFGTVAGVAVDNAGNLYLVDNTRAKVFKVAAAAAATPVVAAATNGASFAVNQPLAQGSLASLFGTSLAPSSVQASTIPLPSSLGGVSVTIGGITAPLLFVSSEQINLQVPWNLQSGTADVVVSVNGSVSAAFRAPVGGIAPGIFSLEFGGGQAIAINLDSTLAAPAGSISGLTTHPAKVGETILVLATGLGLVTPAINNGAASSDTLRHNIITPNVLIGGVPAQVSFSGLSPQFVGVNQLNVIVPSVRAGVVPLQIDVAGTRSSEKVTIAVANP